MTISHFLLIKGWQTGFDSMNWESCREDKNISEALPHVLSRNVLLQWKILCLKSYYTAMSEKKEEGGGKVHHRPQTF